MPFQIVIFACRFDEERKYFHESDKDFSFFVWLIQLLSSVFVNKIVKANVLFVSLYQCDANRVLLLYEWMALLSFMSSFHAFFAQTENFLNYAPSSAHYYELIHQSLTHSIRMKYKFHNEAR